MTILSIIEKMWSDWLSLFRDPIIETESEKIQKKWHAHERLYRKPKAY
jgi:hypothetical protein